MKIAEDAAARLIQKPWFQRGCDAPYSLFAGVPVQCLAENREPILTEYSDSESLTIDLLLCRGEEREVVFGAMFDTEERLAELTEVFEYDLRGMAYLFLPTSPDPSPEENAALCAQFCAYAEHKLLHPEAGAKFTLPALSLAWGGGPLRKELRRYGGEELRRLLTRRRLLSQTGAVTLYGRDCGVFFRWFADPSGRLIQAPMTSEWKAEALNEALFYQSEDGDDGPVPLEERMRRLNRGLPSGGTYGARMASALQELLNTPLEYFCGRDSALWQGLSIGEYRLGRVAEPGLCSLSDFTYRDALATIHDLAKSCLATPFEDRDPNDSANGYISASFDCITLLRELADRLFESQKSHGQAEPAGGTQSLSARLSALDESHSRRLPILQAQLSHYFHAAAMLDESDYPNWFYGLFFPALRRGMHLEDYRLEHIREEQMTLSLCVDILLCRGEFSTNLWGFELDSFDPFWLLYDLLVEPIFPDPDFETTERSFERKCLSV